MSSHIQYVSDSYFFRPFTRSIDPSSRPHVGGARVGAPNRGQAARHEQGGQSALARPQCRVARIRLGLCAPSRGRPGAGAVAARQGCRVSLLRVRLWPASSWVACAHSNANTAAHHFILATSRADSPSRSPRPRGTPFRGSIRSTIAAAATRPPTSLTETAWAACAGMRPNRLVHASAHGIPIYNFKCHTNAPIDLFHARFERAH